jgi:hypothetical protein
MRVNPWLRTPLIIQGQGASMAKPLSQDGNKPFENHQPIGDLTI